MKKVFLSFCLLLLINNSYAEEKLVTENKTENIEVSVEEKPQKMVVDVKSVYDSLNIKNRIENIIEI